MKYIIITHQFDYDPDHYPHFPRADESFDLINALNLDHVSNHSDVDCHCTIYNMDGKLYRSFDTNWFNAIDLFTHDDVINQLEGMVDEYEFALRDDGILGVVNLITGKTMWRESIIKSHKEM